LTIIAEQMPVDAVNLNVWFNVGSTAESDSINGMAHFLEHMIFKGTPRLGNGEFEKRIEQRGAVTNAATSQEYTHYYITTAPQDFADLAPLQVDVVLNPSVPADPFAREKMVVLEEIRRAEDNPNRRLFYRTMEMAFDRLPYRRPVLGRTEIIEQVTPETMRQFHRQWYQPSNITAAVVGNLPTDRLIDIVAEAFERHAPLPTPMGVPTPLTPEPAFTTVVRQEYSDPSLQQARLMMMWRVPGLADLEETYGLDVLAVILGQGKMSRLFRDLREERGLVTQISASNLSQKHQGVFYILAQLPTENLAEVEQHIREHLQNLADHGITDGELQRIATQVANRFIFANERPSDRANLYGYYHSQMGEIESALTYPQKIQALTVEDLRGAARRYLSPSAYGMVIMKPEG
jgi:predicted Zn-dependent peptidase